MTDKSSVKIVPWKLYTDRWLINNQDIRETNQKFFVKKNEFFKAMIERSKKMQRYASKRLSKKERRVDALALRADERRDKLR